MKKRFVLKQFAGKAENNGIFGSYNAGTPTITNDVDKIQSLSAWDNGWLGAVGDEAKIPKLEEIQGLEYVLCKAIKELYSQGIPFWDEKETYYKNAVCSFVNNEEQYNLYRNLTGANGVNTPDVDILNWQVLNFGKSTGRKLPIFSKIKIDFACQDENMVCAKNHTWLDGKIYNSAYNYLINNIEVRGFFEKGQEKYLILFDDGEIIITDISVSGTVDDLKNWGISKGYTVTGSTFNDIVVYKHLIQTTENIDGINIPFYMCRNGMKIILTEQFSALDKKYTSTIFSKYFILDKDNTRFKLPIDDDVNSYYFIGDLDS